MADLIDRTRALYNLANRSTTSAENTTLDALCTAVSKAVRRYCRREFDSQSFDELYNGSGTNQLVLRQFPVISVGRVAYRPWTVLTITNTSSSNQRATVAVTSTGLTLTRVASGTTTTNTLAFASYATLSALAAAVGALGNGWSGTVPDSTYASWASADLRAIQGALNAANNAQALLRLHVEELSVYEVDTARGWLLRPNFPITPTDFDSAPVFFGGPHYWRVVYTAGYATVPEDVQEACAEWVAALFWQTKRDPGLTQEAIPGSVSRSPLLAYPPPSVAALLQRYRDHKIMRV